MENHRILIVEDDEAIAGEVSRIIESWGLTPRCVRDFRDVLREFTDFDPHLVLLDITLPFFNGYHWCSEIRKISAVPIIFVSSASENMNILMAVDMGGDDFIAKPFDPSVLMAKIRAVLRRTYDLGDRVPVIERGGAVLNLNDETVTHDGQKVQLTRNEFRILQTLMESRGKVVSRETLMTRLWEYDLYIEENTLTVNMTRLRKKLFKNEFLRAAVGGIVVILLTLLVGTRAYNGGGMDVIERIFEEGVVRPEAFLLKMIFTSITIGAGFKGGEIVPTLFIGATLGGTLALLVGLSPAFGAAIGIAALFCGVTNCPIATILLSVELFGGESALFCMIAALVSFLFSGYFSLYSGQQLIYSKLSEKEINVHGH